MTSANNREKVRILIVDDEADIRTVMAKGLGQEGFVVDSGGDPEEVSKTYKAGT